MCNFNASNLLFHPLYGRRDDHHTETRNDRRNGTFEAKRCLTSRVQIKGSSFSDVISPK